MFWFSWRERNYMKHKQDFYYSFHGIEDTHILILSSSPFTLMLKKQLFGSCDWNKFFFFPRTKFWWNPKMIFLTCEGGASLEQFFHSSPDLWIYMFFFIFDFFVFFVCPKMSLLSTSTPLHLQWGLWWSDSVLSSLIQHFIFFFSSAGQTSLRGIFKEERGKTLFRHQSIKVWASKKTTAAGGHCADYLCPSHHLFMVTMVRQSVAAGGLSVA